MKKNFTILAFSVLLASNVLAQTFKHAVQPNKGNSLLDCLNIDAAQQLRNTVIRPNGDLAAGANLLRNIADVNYCEGYIFGTIQAITGRNNNKTSIDGVNPPLVCLRPTVTFAQAIDVIKNYLYAHPESRDKNSSGLILAAMQEAFPCSNAPAPPGTQAPPGTPAPQGTPGPAK
jgi:hypothetical protein